MFALYKNHKNPSKEIIEDELTGNLCRCTGYHSIFKAAETATSSTASDQFAVNEQKTISLLKTIAPDSRPVSIITNNQKYFRPNNLSDCFDFLGKYPKAICINGSTDIALKQTKKFEHIKEIIDLSAIRELKFFNQNKTEIIIGSGLSLEDIKSKLNGSLPAFATMLNVFASKQIRNLATLGGNVATASPIGDTLPLLMVYNTKIRLTSKKGERTIPIEHFIKGYRKTALKKDEIIHSLVIPKPENKLIRFYKISKRKDVDISTVSAGFRIELKNGKVHDICLAFGGMAEMVKRAKTVEDYLIQKEWKPENIHQAQKLLENEFHPISDARSGADFRKTAAKNLLIKFFEETKNEHASAR
jgi:xanthine dehydrogenase small subunit